MQSKTTSIASVKQEVRLQEWTAQIKRYESELCGTLFFRSDISPLTNGMRNIIDFNNYAKKHYGFSILGE